MTFIISIGKESQILILLTWWVSLCPCSKKIKKKSVTIQTYPSKVLPIHYEIPPRLLLLLYRFRVNANIPSQWSLGTIKGKHDRRQQTNDIHLIFYPLLACIADGLVVGGNRVWNGGKQRETTTSLLVPGRSPDKTAGRALKTNLLQTADPTFSRLKISKTFLTKHHVRGWGLRIRPRQN